MIIGVFEHSLELELALAELEQNNIPRNHILAVPMDTSPKTSASNTDTLNDFHTTGIEVGMACGTALSVIGASMGFVLALGPVFWGLAASFIGFGIGLGLHSIHRKNLHKKLPKKLPEVAVMVQCPESQFPSVVEIMSKYHALTVGKVPDTKEKAPAS